MIKLCSLATVALSSFATFVNAADFVWPYAWCRIQVLKK